MSTIDAIEHRLSALEQDLARSRRSARRARTACVTLLLVVVGAGGLAASNANTIADVIQARRIEIVDKNDKLVLALHAGALGGQFDIWNAREQNLLRLSAGAHGGDIALWNDDGVNVFGAFATRNGGSASIWSGEGREVFTASTNDDGGGRVEVGNEDGKTVAAIDAIPEVGAALAILDTTGRQMLIAGAHEHGGAINLFNPRGVPIFIAGFGADQNSGAVTLRNGLGTQIFHAGADDDGGGRLTIWNAAGRNARTFSCIR